MVWPSVFCLLLVLPACLAYARYKEAIPNANNIKHPCIPNYRWQGVGHKNRNGGGERNVFGEDFFKSGHKWSKSLCSQDSDGDGRTNGEELGDPQCVWSPGKTPSIVLNITHPGICEPLNHSRCEGKNSFVSCELDSFDNCEVINNTETLHINLKFKQVDVPAIETTYMCMTFQLPDKEDFHIVADEAIIVNADVLHHMLLFGCRDNHREDELTPAKCEMYSDGCDSIIGAWTVGQTGQCHGDSFGFRIGKTGYKKVRLQIHYNNPAKITTYTDSSGLKLYYRPAKEGVKDMVTLVTGQMVLELPPGQAIIEKVGVCKKSCLNEMLRENVYVVRAINHMHYFGRSMTVELVRNGSVVVNLTDDKHYSYDSPFTHIHDPAVKIEPGDEIVTRCVYDTRTSSRYVYFGDGTSDEMCFGFLQVYPKSALRSDKKYCESHYELSSCEYQHKAPIGNCDWGQLSNVSNPNTIQMAHELNKNCNLDGLCRPECKDVIKNISSHPCFQGETGKFVKSELASSEEASLIGLLGRLQSCPVCDVASVSAGADRCMCEAFVILAVVPLAIRVVIGI